MMLKLFSRILKGMSEKLIFKSAELGYMLNPDEIQKMSLDVLTFQNPLARLSVTKQALENVFPDTNLQIDMFGRVLSTVLDTLDENSQKLAISIPELFATLLDSDIADEQMTQVIITILREVGYEKSAVRNWILNSTKKAEQKTSDTTVLSIRGEQSKQLEILEKIYETK